MFINRFTDTKLKLLRNGLTPPMTLDTRKVLSLLLIPIYLVLIAIFLFLNIGSSFNPPILLLLFNTLFLGLIPLYVAYIAYKSFRASGSNGVLLEGTGMLILGLGAIAAGIVNYLPDSMNANVTVHNTSFSSGAFLQFVGILIALSGTVPRQRPGDGLKISAIYSGIVVIFCSFVVVTVQGKFPFFFVQGIGFTVVRELIITGAILFFALASAILLWLYFQRHKEFFFWYSIGLALIGIGLFAVHFPSILGSPLGWVGRSAQYLGAVYVLIAFIALDRSARQTGISIPDMLSQFFGEAETSYKALVETATDAIVVFDPDDRIIVWNGAAEKMFGYSQSEAVGSSFVQLAIPDEFADIIRCSATCSAEWGADLTARKPVEITARRKDRYNFPVELALSRHIVAGTPVCTCIIRDLTDRKKTEEDLRESEDRFRTIAEKLPVLISLSSSEDSTILYTNTAYNTAFGFSREEIIGRKGPDVYFDPAERTKMIEALRQQGFVSNYRLKAKKADGSPLWLLSSVRPIRFDGKPAIIGASIDIMDLVRAEETLKEAHLRTSAILEGIADTFYSLDEKWRFVVVNPAAEKAPFGRPAAEMLGKVIWELYPGLVGTRIHRYYLDAAEKHSLEHYEALSPLNGRWYEVFMKGMKGGVDVYMRDITERMHAEEALRESEERHRLLSETMLQGVVHQNADGTIISMNPAAERILGKSREQFLGSSSIREEHDTLREDGKLFPGLEHPAMVSLRTGMPDRGVIMGVFNPVLGEYRWISVDAVPIIRPGTIQPSEVYTVFEDITDRKRAEEELKKKNEDLRALNEDITATQEELQQNVEELSRREEELSKALAEKEVLLSEIHHRVKNNLTAFISLLSLEGSIEETPAGKQLKIDLQNRARSMALVHETLYRTHLFNDVDMGMYLTTLLEQISQSFQTTKAVKIVVDAHGIMLDIPRATPAGLIINELVTNSFKYAFPDSFDPHASRNGPPTIRITLTKNHGAYELIVSDNGIGMPAGFDLATTQTLGLKLVNFLAKHQMRANVEVHPGNGTEFVFRFRE
jgi:PAS domain S-box-containing protein